MHRKVNVKFLLGLVVVSLLGSAGLVGFYRFQAARLARGLLADAEQAAADGRADEAARYFQCYLRVRPADRDAFARYSIFFDEQAQSVEARVRTLEMLDQALALQPQRDDLRRRLARRAMDIGLFTSAAQHLQFLLNHQPADSELEVLLARCALAEKKYANAAEWLDKAIQHDPQRVESYVQLAAVHDELDDTRRLREVMDALVAANPTSYQAHPGGARYHLKRKALDRAAADIAAAQAIAPRDFDVLVVAAEIAFAQGQLERARAWLEECLSMQVQHARVYLLRAAVERQAGRSTDAIACLQDGLTKVPKESHTSLRLPLVDLLVQDGRLVEARRTLQQLQGGKTAPDLLDLLEARLLVQESRWSDVVATLQRLSPPSAPADVALASQMRQLAEHPEDYRQHLALGLTLWTAKGASAEVEASLHRALTIGDWPTDALATYVHYLVRTRQTFKAEPLLEQARLKLAPTEAALALAYAYEALERLDQVTKIYDDALKAKAASPGVLRGGADFHLRHNDFAKAAPHLRRLLDPQVKAAAADQHWARRNLALGLATSGKYPAFQEALALLEKNRDLGEDSLDERRAWAVVLAQQPTRRSEATQRFEDLSDEGKISAGDRFLLVQLHEANRDWAKVREHLSALLGTPGGKTPNLLAYAAQAELRHGTLEQAQVHLAELAKREPDTFRTVVLQARAAQAGGHAGVAVEQLQSLAKREGADLRILALLLEELGHLEAADALFRKYVSAAKQPSAVLVHASFLGRHQRLAEALDLCEQAWKTCAPAEVASVSVALLHSERASADQCLRVQTWLQAALAKTPSALPLSLALAEVQDLQGRTAEAIQLYRRVLTAEPSNILALNNLAWLLGRQDGQSREALALINEAIDLEGPAPQLLDTRAVIYLALGKSGLAVLDLEAATAVDPSASRYFHLAQAHWLSHQRHEAEQALDKARAANLAENQLHATERTAYRQLLMELGAK